MVLQSVLISIFKNDLLLLIGKAVLMGCFAFFVLSCECPTEIDTPRENTPNSFSRIDIYNFSGKSATAFSNNVLIEEAEIGNNGYSSYFAGETIFTLKEDEKSIYSNFIDIKENSEYTLLLYQQFGRTKSQLSEDLSDTKVRIFNISLDKMILELPEENIEIEANGNILLDFIPSGGNVNLNNSSKGIVFNGFSESKINNIIINNELDYQYFQSF